MADNTRVNELQDKILKAMDILNAQALNSISFDKTITCKIETDKDKKDGKYEVSDGNRIFTAYSNDTRLRSGDTVYVTVPEGNFENQKMIIGKKTADNDKPFNFTQPFDTFFDMTGNIITLDEIKEENKELIANSIEDEDALIENCKTSTWLIGSKDTNGDIVMTDVSNKDLIKYTRLAVRADFRTWIKNAVRGEYGINIYLRTSKPKTVSAENNAIENNEQIIEQGDYKYNWNNSMMYGNTYNFETYYSQEIVLDLEKQDIGKVDGIAIEFYQKANFYDKFNEPIPSSDEGFETKTMSNEYERYLNGNGYYIKQGNDLSPNIFIDNLYLSFGYNISTFTDDYVEIYTQNRNSYRRSTKVGNDYTKENQKEIKMRWVHMQDGTPVDMVAAAGEMVHNDQPNYEVRWYRYRVGAAAADEYCGVYWERIITPIEAEWQQKLKEIVEDTTLAEEERNTKLEEVNKTYSVLKAEQDFTYTFNPDVNKQQENIKAIVLCEGNTPYRSNELLFKNEEELPPSEEAQHIANALNIECDDRTNGNYMIYGQNGSIKDTAYGKETRTMTAYFDADNNGTYTSKIQEGEEYFWIFPAERTMIKAIGGTPIYRKEKDYNGQEIEVLDHYRFDRINPTYEILNQYTPDKANNTITCQYTLNGVVYITEKEFTFGPSGTMGTDQTLVIDFVGDKKAIDINDETCQLQVQLYDSQNKPIIDLEGVEWGWFYNTSNEIKIVDDTKNSSIVTLDFKDRTNNFIQGLYIIKVKIGKLETYFSIPIKNGYNYISGPTEVVYQTNGKPYYSKDPYALYFSSGKQVDWRIRVDREYYNYSAATYNEDDFNNGKYYTEKEGIYYWVNPETQTYNEQITYYVKNTEIKECYFDQSNNTIKLIQDQQSSLLVPAEIIKYTPEIVDNKLRPLEIFIENAPVYGVQALVDNKVVWTQPILVIQNKWPNGVINKWDGKSVQMNEQNGSIVAAAIAAGKKHSEDNTFSGVMMGDWSEKQLDTHETIAGQTGLYGFHHGDMSYAFKEDGTGFIGKSSMARINFDGSNATIYSAGYKDTVNNPGGMMINLYNNGEPFIELKSKEEDGKSSTMRFDTKNSKSEIKMTLANNEDGKSRYIRITNSDSSTNPLSIGNDFSVSWEGSIKANSGTIGSWEIVDGKLQSDDEKIVLSTEGTGTILINEDDIIIRGSYYDQQKKKQMPTQMTLSNNSIIHGGIIEAGTLKSNSSTRIKLEGYFQLNNGGYIGEMETNLPGYDGEGVGMAASRTDNTKGIVKATENNAGISFGNSYVTAQDNSATMGAASYQVSVKSTTDDKWALFYGATNQQYFGINNGTLVCDGIEAKDQYGIYARFA